MNPFLYYIIGIGMGYALAGVAVKDGFQKSLRLSYKKGCDIGSFRSSGEYLPECEKLSYIFYDAIKSQ